MRANFRSFVYICIPDTHTHRHTHTHAHAHVGNPVSLASYNVTLFCLNFPERHLEFTLLGCCAGFIGIVGAAWVKWLG